VVEKVRPSVVRIETSESVGTGFLLASNGLIVTNAHVVGDHLAVNVTLHDTSVRVGLVIGTAPEEDLALIAIAGYEMPVLELGSTQRTGVGAEVLALGYALDLPGTATLTRGLVSAFRSNAFGTLTAIQTDTALNPGNSGGPLLDLEGRVVGINSAVLRGAEGINFAISIDEALPIIEEMRRGESVQLGEYVNEISPYKIAVPTSWRVFEIVPGYVYLRDEESSARIIIMAEPVGEGVATDEYADSQTKAGANQDYDSYARPSSKQVTLPGNIRAWEITELWKKPENDFHNTGKEYFFVAGGLGISIYTQSVTPEWAAVEAAIDGMISSFMFDAPTEGG
jgi:hypothetical protein